MDDLDFLIFRVLDFPILILVPVLISVLKMSARRGGAGSPFLRFLFLFETLVFVSFPSFVLPLLS